MKNGMIIIAMAGASLLTEQFSFGEIYPTDPAHAGETARVQ